MLNTRRRVVRQARGILGVGAAWLVVGCISACAPTVIGEPQDPPHDLLLTGDVDAAVKRTDASEWISLTTLGSSQCPIAPTGMQFEDDFLKITTSTIGGTACTLNHGPTSYRLDLPVEVRDVDPVDVIITLPGGDTIQTRLEQ
jgi:hypothetical protein